MDNLIEIITTQGITARYFQAGDIDIEKYIKLVMKANNCPRRSIIKIVITEVNYALSE